MAQAGSEAKFVAALRRELVACGVPCDTISIVYADILQSHEATISCGPLPADQVACVALAASASCHITFTHDQNKDLLRRWEQETYMTALREQAETMPDVPRYDPARMTLEEFARAVEDYSDIEPGSGLEVRDSCVILIRSMLPLEPGGLQRFGRLMQALSIGLLDHPELKAGIIGGT